MPENKLLKLWYKIFNKNKYRDLKDSQRTIENLNYYNQNIYSQILDIQKKIENKKELSFLHSGQMGDIIYSLASIKELSKTHKCKLYIQTDKPINSDFTNSSRKFLNSLPSV